MGNQFVCVNGVFCVSVEKMVYFFFDLFITVKFFMAFNDLL